MIQKRRINIFTEFKKSLERQYKENKEFQKDVKLLTTKKDDLIQSEPVKLAKNTINIGSKLGENVGKLVNNAYDKTTETLIFKHGSEAITKTAKVVGEITHKVNSL